MAENTAVFHKDYIRVSANVPYVRWASEKLESSGTTENGQYVWQISMDDEWGFLRFWHNAIPRAPQGTAYTSATRKKFETILIGGNIMLNGVPGTWDNDSIDPDKFSVVLAGEDGGLWCAGDVRAQNVTSTSTSDIRLKTISTDQPVYTDKIKSLGDVVSYKYKLPEDKPKTLSLDTKNNHDGLVYQNAVKANIPNFTGEDNGYGYVNYLSSDYQAILLGAVQQLIKRVEVLEEKVNGTKKENDYPQKYPNPILEDGGL